MKNTRPYPEEIYEIRNKFHLSHAQAKRYLKGGYLYSFHYRGSGRKLFDWLKEENYTEYDYISAYPYPLILIKDLELATMVKLIFDE